VLAVVVVAAMQAAATTATRMASVRPVRAKPRFLTYDQFRTWWQDANRPAAKERAASAGPHGRLPRLLWRTAEVEAPELPEPVLAAMASWTQHAPQWTQVYMSDADRWRFIADTQSTETLGAYEALLPGAFRADLWRLLVVLQYGGLYSDIGHTLLRPLEPALDPVLDVLVLTPDLKDPARGNVARIANALFAGRPGDPVLAAMLTHVVAQVRARKRGTDCLDITGPTALGRVFTRLMDLPIRPSALFSTKTCIFVAPLVRGGGFARDYRPHACSTQKYMGNTIACMLTFVRVIYLLNGGDVVVHLLSNLTAGKLARAKASCPVVHYPGRPLLWVYRVQLSEPVDG
jgi:hypothetical protein